MDETDVFSVSDTGGSEKKNTEYPQKELSI